jgi:hypothetical protein
VLAPFSTPLAPAADETTAAPASAEEVGSFFSSFSSGVERGLAEAEADDERGEDTSTWGIW